MGTVKNIAGQRFGRLVALSYTLKPEGKSGKRVAIWLCKCDCGNYKEVLSTHLVQGATQSCGCLHKELFTAMFQTHGLTKKRFYLIWQNMLTRTGNKRVPSYYLYGGRGITVCDKWSDFMNFKADMYDKYLEHVEKFGEKDTSIERIDNDKGYCPVNCRWATRAEQSLNTRRNKRYLINDELLSLTEISRKYNIAVETLFYRLKKGWPMDKILIDPSLRNRVI